MIFQPKAASSLPQSSRIDLLGEPHRIAEQAGPLSNAGHGSESVMLKRDSTPMRDEAAPVACSGEKCARNFLK